MSNPNANSAPSRPRRKRKNNSLLILAAGIFIFGAAAATLYYLLQPTTLRIAVGPPGSDDQKLIQLMAQTFARDDSAVRLSLVIDPGRDREHRAVQHRQGRPCGRARRSEPAGQCRVRRHPAQERRRAVGAVRSSRRRAPRKRRWPRSRASTNSPATASASSDEPEANVKLLRTILTEAGINADKVTVTQFGVNQLAEMARDQTVDAFMTVGPLNSKITVDAINATVAVARRTEISPDRGVGDDFEEAPDL